MIQYLDALDEHEQAGNGLPGRPRWEATEGTRSACENALKELKAHTEDHGC